MGTIGDTCRGVATITKTGETDQGVTTIVIGVKFVSTFVNWGDQSLVPNIWEDARAEDDVKE